MEDVDGEQNEWKTLQGQVRDIDDTHLLLFGIIVIVYYYLSLFTAGPDPEARPAVVLAAGRLEGPDDGAEETQAETRSVSAVLTVLIVFTLPSVDSEKCLLNILYSSRSPQLCPEPHKHRRETLKTQSVILQNST